MIPQGPSRQPGRRLQNFKTSAHHHQQLLGEALPSHDNWPPFGVPPLLFPPPSFLVFLPYSFCQSLRGGLASLNPQHLDRAWHLTHG